MPQTPDLVEEVHRRIAGNRSPRSFSAYSYDRRWRVAISVTSILLVGWILLTSISDSAADLFGVPGIRIEFGNEEDKPRSRVALGEIVSLDTANTFSGSLLQVLDPATFGLPDQVFAETLPDTTRVISLLYEPDARLPEAMESGAGLLLMELSPSTDSNFFVKRIMGNGTLTPVTVGAASGFWIEGTSELMLTTDAANPAGSTESRPSANVLIWSSRGVTYRMESALTMDAALAIANSLEVVK